ncbi:MAG: hypothetical protein JW834_00395 [Candidatus Diapherotrites archaeon]|nr:hypothetical protein [Candidatus Diapherotrites archaeon]
MGEIVEIPKELLEESGEEAAPKKKPEKKDRIAMQKQAAQLIKNGYTHGEVLKSLRSMGFTHKEVEDILSSADVLIMKERKAVDWRAIITAAAALTAIALLVSLLVSGFISGRQDCGSDTFCYSKIASCEEGAYTSTYAGTTKDFDIAKEYDGCGVQVTVKDSPGGIEQKGMSMYCLYPQKGGEYAQDYAYCNGSLTDAWKLRA